MSSDTQSLDIDTSVDALVVGAGFGGVQQLYQLRKLGYSVKIFDAGSALGGVWWWNCYPGARVDSEVPLYEYADENLWRDWNWTERFPGQAELRKYFEYVDSKLDITKDVSFNKRVVAARWLADADRWMVSTEDGEVVYPRFLVLCTGFAAKEYIPEMKGLEMFAGICHHTAKWPQEGVDMKGKRVGVIGTGASGVQVIQEIGSEVEHLTVFQRTPNFATPMRQMKFDVDRQKKGKDSGRYSAIFRRRRETWSGYSYDLVPLRFFDVSPSARVLHFEDQWERGGFRYVVENFHDYLVDQNANDEVYEFWKKKVRERLHDPIVQEKLAPTVAPHPFAAKRACLEDRYYEVFNQSNVDLVNLRECPIAEVTRKGVVTSDGIEHDLDVLVLATGFDSVTGGITQIDIRGEDGISIKDKWTKGVGTYLGMTTSGFPNMFFMYGPQGPTALCNGPTCVEIQGEWITNCIEQMRSNGITRIDAKPEAEEEWRNLILQFGSTSLMSKVKSWYNGGNIPGKVVEPLNFMGGVPAYDKMVMEAAAKGYEGFDLASKQ